MFRTLPPIPDHVAIERGILDAWEREQTFEQLRARNSGGPIWSFTDGPITANGRMGVHHCWGRSLKDLFQRYKAMNGFDQRYQNGFDCQGLWVEVTVERALGLNSKKEIEEYGLAEFARRCTESVAENAEVITEMSKRLGMWMDWDNDYYTFSDTNIEYIWRFLQTVHERGWLYKGHRANVWCPRCGTAISQHELIGSYEDRVDPSLYVRFPLVDRPDEALVVWTTTPWTLPANVAAAVKPDAEYVVLASGEIVAAERLPHVPLPADVVRRLPGAELVGLRYTGPFDDLEPGAAVEHRVVAWDDVTLEEGTGIVHIAPGAGAEDFELSKVESLPVLMPVDEAGRFAPEYGWLAGLSTDEAKDRIIEALEEKGILVGAGEIEHRYPVCWRCATPLIFRIVDEWFIAADEIRPQMLAANATVEWTPDFYSKRMDDWLRNMGDWNISRKRYFGLPLPFYPCACGRLNVVGSKAELLARATRGTEELQELHRPWVDAVVIACDACGAEVERVPEVGDAWLDAGIVPFSTLGWQNPEAVEHGYANGASTGLSGADLPDNAYWEQWFPADWVSEMREQIRLWFYSQLFMSVTLVGAAPYRQVLAYEKLRDETGREMHKSWGNAIEAGEALERMGADVMRFLFADHVPSQNLNFGYGPANDVKRRLLTLWNSVSFFLTYASIEGFEPRLADLETGPDCELRALDRWLVARTSAFVAEATEGFERFWTPTITGAFESFVGDLSNWYIRRSRKRFYTLDEAAFRTLWTALVQAIRVISPVLPFLAEELWQRLVTDACADAPASVFLAGWPAAGARDDALLAEVDEVRRVVTLAHSARAQAGLKLRQPLRRMSVLGAHLAQLHKDEIAEELRVKEVLFEKRTVAKVRLKPQLRRLGPRLGSRLPAIKKALDEGQYELDGENVIVDGETLTPEDVIAERIAVHGGWVIAADDDLSVEIDPELDDELLLEGRVLDRIHEVNTMRKDAGLELTDRIALTLPAADHDLEPFAQQIKDETLAISVGFDGSEPRIDRVAAA